MSDSTLIRIAVALGKPGVYFAVHAVAYVAFVAGIWGSFLFGSPWPFVGAAALLLFIQGLDLLRIWTRTKKTV